MYDTPEQKRDMAVKAQRLQALANAPEWHEFLALCEEEYKSLTRSLYEKDDPEARGGIKTITKLLSKIQRDIAFGEKCARDLFESANKRPMGLGQPRG